MKKSIILSLAIFYWYGCGSVNTISEAVISEEESTEVELSEKEATDVLMMVTMGKGIASNLMDLFCNRGLTDLEFNGKKYSSIQTLYKEEVNTNTQTLIKDTYLKNSSDCDYNREICNENSEPHFTHTYEQIIVKDDVIWFYSYYLKYDPNISSIQDLNLSNSRPYTMFSINRTSKTVLMSAFINAIPLSYKAACTSYKESLRIRSYTPKIKDLKIEKKAEKEDPIELKGQKFDILSTKISYNSDPIYGDNTEFSSPIVQTETTWTADSGELKGFGLKHLSTRESCKTYTDAITLAGVTKKAECKRIVDTVRSTKMIDYKFTPAE